MGVDISISVIKMLSVQAEGTALVRARGLGPTDAHEAPEAQRGTDLTEGHTASGRPCLDLNSRGT